MAAPKKKAASPKPAAKRKRVSHRELIDTGTNKLFVVSQRARYLVQEGGRCRPVDHSGQAAQGQAQGAIRPG